MKEDADSRAWNEVAGAADTLRYINLALMIHYELRSKDALSVLTEHMNDVNCRVSPRIQQLYANVRSKLEDIVDSEPLHGTNAKLQSLRSLLTDLYERSSDPRGSILLCAFIDVILSFCPLYSYLMGGHCVEAVLSFISCNSC